MRRLIFTAGSALFLASVALVTQAAIEDITFPVAELGNCASEEACFAYCGVPENEDVCFDFAVQNDLIEEVEREKVELVRQVREQGGPGGCQSPSECRAYCDDPAHGEECVEFAVAQGLIPPEKAELVRQVIREGGPGGCRTEKECKTYCDDPAHGEECLAFASQHGLVDEREAKFAEKILKEGGPGGCFSEESCRAYCDDTAHLEECVQFAVDNDLMSKEEAQRVLASGGTGPGGCRGEECKDYCEDPAHAVECVEFGVEQGFIPPEEAELARTVAREGGPGGCRSERECRDYCEEPEHGQECFEFGVRHGLIPPDEEEKIRKFIDEEGPGGCRGRACRDYCEEPGHEEECLNFAIEKGMIPPEEAERAKKGLEIMRQGGPGGCRGPKECDAFCSEPANEEVCFEFATQHDLIPPEERERAKEFREKEKEILRLVEDEGGPGGCRGKRECMDYCSDPVNEAECNAFAAQHGFTPPPRPGEPPDGFAPPALESFVGPGGCQTPGECANFCSQPENKQECIEFRPPPALQRFEPREERRGRLEEIGPGGCVGRDECLQFCSDPANGLECTEFKRRLMERERFEEFEMRREGREEFREGELEVEARESFEGPGGCSSPAECFRFCQEQPEECGEFKDRREERVERMPPQACAPMSPPRCAQGEFLDVRHDEQGCPLFHCVMPDDFFEERRPEFGEFDEEQRPEFKPEFRPESPSEFREEFREEFRGEPEEFREEFRQEFPEQFREFREEFPEELREFRQESGEEFREETRREAPEFFERREQPAEFGEPGFNEPPREFREPAPQQEFQQPAPFENFTPPAGEFHEGEPVTQACGSALSCLRQCLARGQLAQCRAVLRLESFASR